MSPRVRGTDGGFVLKVRYPIRIVDDGLKCIMMGLLSTRGLVLS